MNVDEFIDGYTPPELKVPICQKSGLIAEHQRLEAAVAEGAAGGGLVGPGSDLVEQLAAIEEEMETAIIVFTIRGVSRREWQDLIAAHPPTDEDVAVGRQVGPGFNHAAIALCCVEPKLTIEQLARLEKVLPQGEFDLLTEAVSVCNLRPVNRPKSPAVSFSRLVSAVSAPTSATEESPEASSSDALVGASPSTSTTTPAG